MQPQVPEPPQRKLYDTTLFPAVDSGPADAIWLQYFAANEPSPARVRREVKKLHTDGHHEHAVRLIEAALIHSQSQPWMYEVLALSMEMAGRPKEDVERVSLSMADFGQANYDSMLQSARYLAGFNSTEAALRLLKQTASLAPEREEAYLVALPVAEKSADPASIVWAASGILATSYDRRAAAIRRKADSLAKANLAVLKRQQSDQAAEAEAMYDEALAIDLEIELTWTGEADLDLEITEPNGTVCSFRSPVTPGGGIIPKDGFGPGSSEETYIAARAFPGVYEVRVRPVSGAPTGGRARLSVSIRQANGDVRTQKQTLRVGDEAVGFSFNLEAGRRQKPRDLAVLSDEPRVRPRVPRPQGVRQPVARQPRGGAIGFAPQIQTISEGASVTGSAVVSPDRRYVRIGVSPWFNSITDVFTFSAVSGGGGAQGGQGGAAGP